MASPTPEQVRRRERIESLLRLAEPGLNLVLAAGDRLSRLVDRSHPEPYLAPGPRSQALSAARRPGRST